MAEATTPAAAAPRRMPVIRMDPSKTYSECRGERAQDDPHYKVHFWQAYRVGKNKVLLPFDAQGVLVADDNKTEPYAGIAEGKPVMHLPLYSKEMRALVATLIDRLSGGAAEAEAEAEDTTLEVGGGTDPDAGDIVNFASWLRGEVQYEPFQLKAAAKTRFSRVYTQISQMVVDLVLDEKVVAENEVCTALAKYLPPRAA